MVAAQKVKAQDDPDLVVLETDDCLFKDPKFRWEVLETPPNEQSQSPSFAHAVSCTLPVSARSLIIRYLSCRAVCQCWCALILQAARCDWDEERTRVCLGCMGCLQAVCREVRTGPGGVVQGLHSSPHEAVRAGRGVAGLALHPGT